MACGCLDKKTNVPTSEEIKVHNLRLGITCGCGLFRLLPTGLSVGDKFELVPCPKCNQGLRGQLVSDGVQEVV